MKYQTITKDGETLLREVNPIDQRFALPGCADVCMNREESIEFNHFEQSAIANAKVLINPVPGKVEYSSDELREVYRRESYISASEKCMIVCDYGDYLIAREDTYNNLRTDIAFEYIGEKVEEKQISEIQQVKNDNYLLTIKVDQLERELKSERSRIIGLIESEKLAIEKCLENMNRSNEFRNSCHTELSVLNKLLTLIKQNGK